MNSTHSSTALSIATLVPVLKWLLTWPIHSPDDTTLAALAGLIIASPPAFMAAAAWLRAPKP